MAEKLPLTVINRIMDRAEEISKSTPDECRNFTIMESPEYPDTLILRWTSIDVSDIERPVQCYLYECFNPDGTTTDCRISHKNQEAANQFFWGLKPRFQQTFCNDHKV